MGLGFLIVEVLRQRSVGLLWTSDQPDAETSTCTTLTYLLTPWSRVPFEKLTGSAASQEISRIFGARSFLTVLTSARHLSLS